MASGKRSRVDWEACEKEYRTGTFSNRQLAEKYGCTEAAIRDRVKRYGWQKDLVEEVKKATSHKLLRAELRTEEELREDAKIVDVASDIRAGVVLEHRKDIRKLRDVAARLLVDLEIGEEVLPLPQKSSVFRDLCNSLARVIPLERQAHGLDEAGGSTTSSPAEELMAFVQGSVLRPKA